MRWIGVLDELMGIYPHFSPLITNAKFVRDDSVPIAAITPDLTLLYNQHFMDTCKDWELKFVVLHELFHILNKHHVRMKNAKNESPLITTHRILNIACDLEINSHLEQTYKLKGMIGLCYPKNFGFKEGLSAESYFGLLMSKAITSSQLDRLIESMGNDPSSMIGDIVDVDGVEVDMDFIDGLIQQCKDKDPGSADYDGSLKVDKKRIIHNWKSLIKRLLTSKLEMIKDRDLYTYKRPNRRHNGSEIIFPTPVSSNKRKMTLIILVDVSGSMHNCINSCVNHIFSLIAELEKSYHTKLDLHILEVSTKVHRFEPMDCRTYTYVKLGGGTDLPVGFKHLEDLKFQYDSMLVFTDCGTPWIKVKHDSIHVITDSMTDEKTLKECPYPKYFIRM